LVADGETSWHGYAKHVVGQLERVNHAIKIAVKEVIPVSTDAFPTLAKRPHNSRLDTRKLQSAFGRSLPPWQQGVDRMLSVMVAEDRNDSQR
jgi:dTDP-4-dehydrorhamnose reductase